MQISKPPLGIRAPLLGQGIPLSLSRPLLYQKSTFPPLLHKLNKPLALQGLEPSHSFNYSEFLPAFANSSSIGWNAEFSDIEVEPLKTIEENDSGVQSYLYTPNDTDVVNQTSYEVTNQKKARTKNKSKTNNKQAKPKSTKKASLNTDNSSKHPPTLKASSVSPLVTGESVENALLVADSVLPSKNDELILIKRVIEDGQAVPAESESVTLDSEQNVPVLKATDISSQFNTPQVDSTLPSSTAGEAVEGVTTLESGVLERLIGIGQLAVTAKLAVLNPERENAVTPNVVDIPSHFNAPQVDSTLPNNTVREAVESAASQENSNNRRVANKSIRHLTEDRQTVAAELELTVPSPESANIAALDATDISSLDALPADRSLPSGSVSEAAEDATTLADSPRQSAASQIDILRDLTEARQPALTGSMTATPPQGENADAIARRSPQSGIATDIPNHLDALQADSASPSSTADKAVESVITPEAPPSQSEAGQSTVLRHLKETGQQAVTKPEPAAPHTENVPSYLDASSAKITPSSSSVEGATTTEDSPSQPDVLRHSTAAKQTAVIGTLPVAELENTVALNATSRLEALLTDRTFPSSTTSEAVKSATTEDFLTQSAVNQSISLRNLIEDEQLAATETLPVLPNPQIADTVNTTAQDALLPPAPKDTDSDSMPSTRGYAVGGHVAVWDTTNSQQVAPSDTVPAMLTPGEFVVNAADAQKNLNLLKHINSGGTVADDFVTPYPAIAESNEIEDTASAETSTKVESLPDRSDQRKSSNIGLSTAFKSLVTPSSSLETEKHDLSTFSLLNASARTSSGASRVGGETSAEGGSPTVNGDWRTREGSPDLRSHPRGRVSRLEGSGVELACGTLSSLHSDSFADRATQLGGSAHYSSTPLIFRKRDPDAHTPEQWSSVEDLLNSEGNFESFNEFAPLNFGIKKSQGGNSQRSTSQELSSTFISSTPAPRGLAAGGEVTAAPNISTLIQPRAETITSSTAAPGTHEADPTDLEALAREIYHRLRQRLEVERERHGSYSGRLPW